MSALVYQAINAVTGELAGNGIAKSQRHEEEEYRYRGIDDVVKALAPLLARHKLCILPRVLERSISDRGADHRTVLRVAFDLVSAIDASTHTIEAFGEATDGSDKGTSKAMSVAYKMAMLQAFCIPVPEEDSNATSSKPARKRGSRVEVCAEPPGGWDSWSEEVVHIARSCESEEAIERLLGTRRKELTALQRGSPELYTRVGEAIAVRLAELKHPSLVRPKSETRDLKRKKQPKNDARHATAKAA